MGKIIRQHSSEIFDIKGPAPAPLEKKKGITDSIYSTLPIKCPNFLKSSIKPDLTSH